MRDRPVQRHQRPLHVTVVISHGVVCSAQAVCLNLVAALLSLIKFIVGDHHGNTERQRVFFVLIFAVAVLFTSWKLYTVR